MLRSTLAPPLSQRKRALPAIILSMKALTFHAGPLALAQIRMQGLRAQDIAIVPAAAGGPKGLIFQALDLGLPPHKV